MIYFKCLACGSRLYGAGIPADVVGDLCPACGSLLEPLGELAGAVGFRSIKARDSGARGAHERIADRVEDFYSSRTALIAKARDDAARWLDDGGSFRPPPAAPGGHETNA